MTFCDNISCGARHTQGVCVHIQRNDRRRVVRGDMGKSDAQPIVIHYQIFYSNGLSFPMSLQHQQQVMLHS